MLVAMWFGFRRFCRSKELDSMVPTGPFQLEMFCDSMILCLSSQFSRISRKTGTAKLLLHHPRPVQDGRAVPSR